MSSLMGTPSPVRPRPPPPLPHPLRSQHRPHRCAMSYNVCDDEALLPPHVTFYCNQGKTPCCHHRPIPLQPHCSGRQHLLGRSILGKFEGCRRVFGGWRRVEFTVQSRPGVEFRFQSCAARIGGEHHYPHIQQNQALASQTWSTKLQWFENFTEQGNGAWPSQVTASDELCTDCIVGKDHCDPIPRKEFLERNPDTGSHSCRQVARRVLDCIVGGEPRLAGADVRADLGAARPAQPTTSGANAAPPACSSGNLGVPEMVLH